MRVTLSGDVGYATHETLLQWLVGMSVLAWLTVLGFEYRVFDTVLEADRSRLALVIMLAFLAVNVHVFTRVLSLSRERNATAAIRQLVTAMDATVPGTQKLFDIDGDAVRCKEQPLPASLIRTHIVNLSRRVVVAAADTGAQDVQGQLLAVLAARVHGGHKYGWLLADLMIKLGLIGTVIGFVMMLGAVSTLENYDIATMQDLLRNMSGGMRVALFTTLTGLTAGMILALQYQFLERQADALVADITEIAEVHVLPALNRPV